MLNEIHILTVMYGEHCRYFSETMLPSLVRSLDGIHEEIKTKHFIYSTSKETFDISKAEWEVVINRDILVENPREDLYKAVMRQIGISAEAEATIILAMGDHVYGNGLRRLLEKRHEEYVVCAHGRSRTSAVPQITEFIKHPFLNRQFADKNYNEWQHPMVDYGIANPVSYWRATRYDSYIDVYFKEPSPVLFKADLRILDVMEEKRKLGHTIESAWGIFETIDHDVVDYYYKNGGLYYCKDSDEFIWTELTNDSIYNPTVIQVEGVNACWIPSAKFFHQTPYKVVLR